MYGLLDDPREHRRYQKHSYGKWIVLAVGIVLCAFVYLFFTTKIDPHADKLPFIVRIFGIQSSWEEFATYRAKVESQLSSNRAELHKEQIQMGMDRNDWNVYLANSRQQIQNLDNIIQRLSQDIAFHSKESASVAKGEDAKSDEHSDAVHQLSSSLMALRVQDNMRRVIQEMETDVTNKKQLLQHMNSEMEQQILQRNQNPLWIKLLKMITTNQVLVDAEGNIQLIEQKEDRQWREVVGSSTWHFLHNVAAKYPEEPNQSQLLKLLHSLQHIFPCSSCKIHIAQTLQDPSLTPLDAFVASREAISIWMCSFHNLVNKRLNKPPFECSLEALDAKYISNCDECKTEDDAYNEQTPQHQRQPPEGSFQVGGSQCGINIFKWLQGGEQPMDFASNDLTLLVFWMPHCTVCKQELPELEKLYQEKNGKGFNIIAVTDATAENESAVRKFIEEKGITYPVAIADFQDDNMAYGQIVGKYKGIPMGSIRRKCKEEWKGMGFGLKNLPGIVKRLLQEGSLNQ